MRLIDADALKDTMDFIEQTSIAYEEMVDRYKKAIDNAPTVELFCSYLSDGEVRQPCVEAPCKHERPTGECSNCDYRKFIDNAPTIKRD